MLLAIGTPVRTPVTWHTQGVTPFRGSLWHVPARTVTDASRIVVRRRLKRDEYTPGSADQ